MIDIDGYINNNGEGCVNCDDGQAIGGETSIDGGDITQAMSCPVCDAAWTNHYIMSDVTVTHEGKQYAYTDEEEVREAFAQFAHDTGLEYVEYVEHNRQHCDTRSAFTMWIDGLAREGTISNTLAGEVTL